MGQADKKPPWLQPAMPSRSGSAMKQVDAVQDVGPLLLSDPASAAGGELVAMAAARVGQNTA